MKSAKDCYKKGGAVKGAKKAHEASGEKSKARVDKRARGGKMTPKSPLSGAEPSGLPGGGKGMNSPDKSND